MAFFPERSLSYSDESRLSNLLRRITREDDRDRRLATVKQLKEFIQQPENKLVGSLYFSVALQHFSFHKTAFQKTVGIEICLWGVSYLQQRKVFLDFQFFLFHSGSFLLLDYSVADINIAFTCCFLTFFLISFS